MINISINQDIKLRKHKFENIDELINELIFQKQLINKWKESITQFIWIIEDEGKEYDEIKYEYLKEKYEI